VELTSEVVDALLYAGVSIFGYQSALSRAKEVNARAETKEEIQIVERERKSNLKHTRNRVNRIESILWKGLDEYREKLSNEGITTTQIHKGNDLLEGKRVSDVKRDYHQAMGKEAVFLVDNIISDVSEVLNTYRDSKGGVINDERNETINDIATDQRANFIDNIHKRNGYNSDIVDMENKLIPFSVFRDVVDEILTHAEKKRIIRENEERKILKMYRVSAFSPIKILKAIVSSRRGSRR